MQKKNEIQAVFFDLDGTIVDTELTAGRVLERGLKEWGIPAHPFDIRFLIGKKTDLALDYLFKKYDFPLSKVQAKEQLIQTYQRTIEEELQVIPGVVEAVRSIVEHYPLALVSGSEREQVYWILEKLDLRQYFKIVLAAEDYPRSKPDPDGYEMALALLDLQPENVVVFEDSEAGINSGRSAGLWVVAVRAAAQNYNQDASRAHHTVENFSEINAEWISNLSLIKNSK